MRWNTDADLLHWDVVMLLLSRGVVALSCSVGGGGGSLLRAASKGHSLNVVALHQKMHNWELSSAERRKEGGRWRDHVIT